MYSFKQAVINATGGDLDNVIYIEGVRAQISKYQIKYKRSQQTELLIKALLKTKKQTSQ